MTAAPPPTGDPDRPEQDPPRSARADAAALLDDAYTQFRTFDRAREGRMVAGVCAGVGRRLGIDPVVVRIVVAVLALVSGAGLVLYGAAWLLLPEEGSQQSIAERLFGRRGGETNSAIMVGIGAIAAIIATGMLPWGVDWWGPVLVALIIGGLVALARRRPDSVAADPHGYPGPSLAPGTSAIPSGAKPPATADAPASTDSGDAADSDPSEPASSESELGEPEQTDQASVTTPPQPDVLPRTWTQHAATPAPPSFWNQPDPLGLESTPEPETVNIPEPEPAPPKRTKRPRSLLFPVTVALALLSVFILAAASGAGESIPLAFWGAIPLGVIGLGLLVGTWYGRSGGLIALGIPLAIAVVPLSLADALTESNGTWPQDGDNQFGDHRFAPSSVAEIEPIYHHGAGDLEVDLSAVQFHDSDAVDVRVESGAGEVTIYVPEDVDVSAKAAVEFGEASVFGKSNPGPSPVVEVVDQGNDGPGGGTLTLDASLAVGGLDIVRGPAPDAVDAPERPEQPERPDVPAQPEEPSR